MASRTPNTSYSSETRDRVITAHDNGEGCRALCVALKVNRGTACDWVLMYETMGALLILTTQYRLEVGYEGLSNSYLGHSAFI